MADPLSQRSAGAHIKYGLRQSLVTALEINCLRPFASRRGFRAIIGEALQKYENSLRLPGNNPTTTVRAWIVCLLVKKCGFSNREAIRRWNNRLGIKYGRYKIDEEQAIQLAGQPVTTSGEVHFSKDKRLLEKRLAITRLYH